LEQSVYIWGKNPVLEVLRAARRKVFEIFIDRNRASEYLPQIDKRKYTITLLDRGEIHNLVQRKDHQGIIAHCADYDYADFSSFLSLDRAFLLAIDSVSDPQNLGAIIRSAYILGANGIILPDKCSADISPVVTHTSAGASEHIDIAIVNSLAHSIQELRKRGFVAYSTAAPNENIQARSILDVESADKIVLVLGSEGSGVAGAIQRVCDCTLYIPQVKPLDSFSVANACAILCFVLAQKRGLFQNSQPPQSIEHFYLDKDKNDRE
jgi:23S rRNA (guanosine2251-2'-O)-methyltransferase